MSKNSSDIAWRSCEQSERADLQDEQD